VYPTQHRSRSRLQLRAALAALWLAWTAGCSDTTVSGQRTFETPEAAAEALFAAVEANDPEATLAVLGPQHAEALVTPDWDAEDEARQEIVREARKSYILEPLGDDERELVIGEEEWPLPIPLVREEGRWRFDTDEGLEEIVNRRIGRNELTAIALANAYVDAQIEYAREDRDGDDVLEYAQRLASTPGQRDGLYWEVGPDEEPSPFGPLVQGAERYLQTVEPGDPLHGYYFAILTRQGENPPGGRYDYVINGNMIAGFALVAYPADYGNSGVMTFVVNHRGKVQQKDVGEFEGMDAYDPDESWTVIED
jgi:hypothetical protein